MTQTFPIKGLDIFALGIEGLCFIFDANQLKK
jgi:hypothetical protein